MWVAKQSPRKSHRFTSFENGLINIWRAVARGSTRQEGWSCYLGSDRHVSHLMLHASTLTSTNQRKNWEKNTKKRSTHGLFAAACWHYPPICKSLHLPKHTAHSLETLRSNPQSLVKQTQRTTEIQRKRKKQTGRAHQDYSGLSTHY